MTRYIKTFTTPGGNYVYDREVNSLLSVSNKEEFESFKRIEQGMDTDKDWLLLNRYAKQGYLKETSLKEIVHPATPYLKFHLTKHVSQLTLQVTQQCNLNCSYCIYSGSYENQRTHGDKKMPLDIMQRSVDFVMERSTGAKDLILGFYGGEPLIEIENIKKCVEYVEKNYGDRSISYTVTTNGTLFADEVVQFLDDKKFSVMISFDGPKDLHDQNRVFHDGRGSFDVIIDNIKKIKEKYPIFFKRIVFMSTVAPGTDLACVNDYFEADDILSDTMVTRNIVSPYSAKEEIVYDDLYGITDTYQHMKVLLAALGIYSKNKISKLYSTSLTEAEVFYLGLSKTGIFEKYHPSGPCLPGVLRPFVDIAGNIFPCERVGEGSELMKIGHIDTGYDIDKADAVLNVGRLTEAECKKCWNFLHCGLCVSACEGEKEFSRERRLKNCKISMNNTLNSLKIICLLLENGYDFELERAVKEGVELNYA